MTMTATDTTPRAWVGCLGCYNNGNLIGRWLEDPDEIREYTCPTPPSIWVNHEELWVFDHENAPWINGECSPVEFADKAEAFNAAVEDSGVPAEAIRAWMANSHYDVDFDDLTDKVAKAFIGEYASAAHWAEEFAEETGEDLGPYARYVDWDAVARDAVYGGDIWVHEESYDVKYLFWNR